MYTVPWPSRGRQMWPGAREAGSTDGERERRPPRWVLSDPLLPAPAFTFPGTKLRGHRSKAKESQVRTYTCTHTADRAGAQGHGDLEGLCRTPPSPGLPTPSTPRRRGAEGGLLLTPRTTPRPALPPPASPGLEMRQEGMGPHAAGHRAENHRVGWGKLRKLLEGPMVPPAWLPHSQWHRRTGPEGVAWGKGTGWGAGARCPEDTASGVESALGSP